VNGLAAGRRPSAAARGDPRSHIAFRAGMLDAEFALLASIHNPLAYAEITGAGAALID